MLSTDGHLTPVLTVEIQSFKWIYFSRRVSSLNLVNHASSDWSGECFHLPCGQIKTLTHKAWHIIWVKTNRCSCVGCRKRTWAQRGKKEKKKHLTASERLRVERTSFISPLVVLAASLSPFLRLEKSSQNTASSSRNKLFAHARVRWNSLERREFSLRVSTGRIAQWDFRRTGQTDLDKFVRIQEK